MCGSHNEAAFGIHNYPLAWTLVQVQQLAFPGHNILHCISLRALLLRSCMVYHFLLCFVTYTTLSHCFCR